MKNKIYSYLTLSAVVVFTACTDLEVKETDSLVTSVDGEFLGVNASETLTSAYNGLNWQNSQEGLFALTEATTDELFIPTRGTDWGDNGVWRSLATHNWNPSHLFNNNAWNYLNSNVYTTNQILHEKTTKTPLQAAEARFLRAYSMFWILDLWRQIPFRDADEGPDVVPVVMTPQEAFDFIIADLEASKPALPTVTSGSIAAQVKASKAAANFMLAKMYLNKHVYLGGTVQAADMDKVIAAVDAIEADGYELHDGYFNIFGQSADAETILWSVGQYGTRIWAGLHYNQGRETDNTGGGWNGFATTADFYNKFEGDPNENYGETASPSGSGQEERRGYVPELSLGIGFLIGTQGGPGGPVKARSGQNLVFTKEMESLTGQPDFSGIRLLKWHPTINMGGTWNNHLVLLRYADALLMKAEALLRKGQAAPALVLVNELRAIRNATPFAGPLTEDYMLDERGRELYMEGWRRNDMVRFGKFATAFAFVDNTDATTNLYPIPELAVGSNPNLKQNPGY